MRAPAIRHHYRLLLVLATAACFITPALALGPAAAAAAAGVAAAGVAAAGVAGPAHATMGSESASGSWSGSSGISGASGITKADTNLDSLMLATPLPGLVNFTVVGPGATNGPLTAQTLGSYSNSPGQVERLFNEYSSESGFAGWIKTWQDNTGTSEVVEIAIRFHQSAEASTNASAFVSTLSKGLSGGTRTNVPSIPGANAFTIDEPSSTSGTLTIPAQQVQAVVFSTGNYLIALHTDSPSGPGAHPIAAGTAIALALQQYQVLASKVSSQAVKPAAKTSSSSGSTILAVGLIMLGAVAIVIASIALVSWRRRQTQVQTQPQVETEPQAHQQTHPRRHAVRSRPQKPAFDPNGVLSANESATGAAAANTRAAPARSQGWPESPALPTSPPGKDIPVGAPSNGAGESNRNGIERTSRETTERNRVRRHRTGATQDQTPEHTSPSKRVSFGRRGRPSSTPTSEPAGREPLVRAGAPVPRGSRSQRLDVSRTNHPSASVALAKARPPAESAGWYTDPSDSQHRRIRYWDGKAWTSHVAEPEV